jgi:hypothetical protein
VGEQELEVEEDSVHEEVVDITLSFNQESLMTQFREGKRKRPSLCRFKAKAIKTEG